MKKVLQILAIPFAVLAFVAVNSGGVAAQAANDCTNIVITNTGAGSVNQVNCNGTYTVTIECQNNTQIVLDVVQNGTSGTATVSGNTNAGGAQTGDAVNTSEIDTLIENSDCLSDETPETPETPEEETPGEVIAATTVDELPRTGTPTGLRTAVLVAIGVLAFALISRTVVSLYARSQK